MCNWYALVKIILVEANKATMIRTRSKDFTFTRDQTSYLILIITIHFEEEETKNPYYYT